MSAYELGRRAVACAHWRWLPGTAVLRDAPGTPFHGHQQTRVDDDLVTYEQAIGAHIIPDLSDPATLGCLLALVREAWPDEWCEFMVPIFDGFSHWSIGCLQLDRLPGTPRVISLVNRETMKPLPWAYSEAEALVIALEAAP